ncbi:MAG: hypothetical protein DMF71_06715 [Acidobacteria bacterium]|nr:MAG: hypothetical protein DMF71_06715 [Acidobacteriota bacterium]
MRSRSSRPTNHAQTHRIIASEGERATIPQAELTTPRPATDESYYLIWRPAPAIDLDESKLATAASLLQLSAPELSQAATLGQPVPLARANTFEQATTLGDELRGLGIENLTVAARELKAEMAPKKIRALEFSEDSVTGITSGAPESTAWAEILLIVAGRLHEKSAVVEARRRHGQMQPVDSRELFADDLVLDLYSGADETGWRIIATGFDFSCLGSEKKMTAVDNFQALTKVLRERASRAEFDDSYVRVRQMLAAVWPLDQETRRGEWRRSGAGKFDLSTVTTTDNATQFTRYSRLRRWLRARELTGNS